MSSATLKAAATGQMSAAQATDPYQQLKGQLERSRPEFLPLLGSMANVDKFFRVVLNAVVATPDLLNADRRSLILACSRAAQDGLMPDGREAVLNIYNVKVKAAGGQPERWEKRAQYLPMVGGLIKKLYESELVTYVDAVCVYKGDTFRYSRGDEPKIEHEPKFESSEFADITHVYCIVKLANGETKREVMGRKDIERVRAASKSADSGPWVTWFDQQSIKSVIKRIYKQLPKADSFDAIERSDNEASGYVAGVGDTMGGAVSAAAQLGVNAAQASSGAPALEDQRGQGMGAALGGALTTGGDESAYVVDQQRQAPGPEGGQQDMLGGDGRPDPDAPVADKPARPAKPAKPAAKAAVEPAVAAGKTYAQLADALNVATSEETAWLMLDADARHLPADQQKDLAAIVERRFPK